MKKLLLSSVFTLIFCQFFITKSYAADYNISTAEQFVSTINFINTQPAGSNDTVNIITTLPLNISSNTTAVSGRTLTINGNSIGSTINMGSTRNFLNVFSSLINLKDLTIINSSGSGNGAALI